jgi:PAS domain S-box-containing protein
MRQASLWAALRTWFSATSGFQVARFSGALVMLVGGIVLVGWGLDLPLLKGVMPGAATMKVNTALCFVLGGLSLSAQARNRFSRLTAQIGRGSAIAVLTIGALTLSQYLFGWDLGIDQLLHADSPNSPLTLYPGRMGDNTALNFVLAGTALLLMPQKTRRSDSVIQAAVLMTIAIALMAVVGSFYGVQVLYQFIFYSTSMAIHTALNFLVLGVGILATRSNQGLMRALTGNLAGSLIARRLVPVAIGVPFVAGCLILKGLRSGLYDPALSIALFSVILIYVSVFFVVINVQKLNRIDRDRIRSDDRMRSSEERLRLALEGAGQGSWDWELGTETLVWDDRCKEIFGLSANFPVTYEWHLSALHPDDRQRVADAATLALRDRSEFEQEYRTICPNGTMRWILARGRGYYDSLGQPYRMSGTVMDITDRKQTEAEIKWLNRELDRRVHELQTILDIVPVGITIAEDPACQVIRANGFAQSMLAVPPDANVSATGVQAEILPYRQLRNGEEIPGEDLPMQQAVRQGTEVRDVEIQMVRSDGVSFDWLVNAVPLLDEQGLVRGCVAAFMDVSALKQTTLTLSVQTEELIRSNRLKDEFLAALSHELRTPLNPILGWTSMMKTRRLTPEKTVEALETIDRNVRQQIRLVDDLLEVSRVVQGKLKLEFCLVDLAMIIQSAIDTVQFAAQAKSITLQFQGLSSLSLMADGDRLQQVFWNLLSNAIKFTPVGGRVDVHLSAENHDVQVRVTDTGVGIEPEFLPHVFDRFRQADGSTTRNYGGLGLGLAIVRHLVELHGGMVLVNSPGVGYGATFTVKLPMRTGDPALIPAAIPASPSSSETIPPSFTQDVTLAGTRILAVDDDPDNLDILQFLLEKDGAIVTIMSSPLDAIELISQQPFDLIISDIGMPQISGYEFIRQVRALPQGQPIPALALTAFAHEEDRTKAIEAGFQAHITKSVNPIELLAILAEMVHSHREDIRHF